MHDDEAASCCLVLGLSSHDGAVDVERVRSGGEDEEERGQSQKDVEQLRNRDLQTLRIAIGRYMGRDCVMGAQDNAVSFAPNCA